MNKNNRYYSRIDEIEDIALFIDNEGSWPILYLTQTDEDSVWFLFAHDYDLFMNDNIDEYTTKDYKIECDVIINKKELLKNFYDILYPFTRNYDMEEAKKGHYDDIFNLENGKKYLNQIKKYLDK